MCSLSLLFVVQTMESVPSKSHIAVLLTLVCLIVGAECSRCRQVSNCCRRIRNGECGQWCEQPIEICTESERETSPFETKANPTLLISTPCRVGQMFDRNKKCRQEFEGISFVTWQSNVSIKTYFSKSHFFSYLIAPTTQIGQPSNQILSEIFSTLDEYV